MTEMTTTDFELIQLEAMLDEHLECQHPHTVTVCSGPVVALSRTLHYGDRLVCAVVVEHQQNSLREHPNYQCLQCLRAGRKVLAADCWRIIPI